MRCGGKELGDEGAPSGDWGCALDEDVCIDAWPDADSCCETILFSRPCICSRLLSKFIVSCEFGLWGVGPPGELALVGESGFVLP
jgi:hypothetical protein